MEYISIPAWYIKNKKVDYRAESLQSLGIPLEYRGRLWSLLRVPPVTMGTMCVLEALGNNFIRSPEQGTPRDIFEAVSVAELRENAPRMLDKTYNAECVHRMEVLFGSVLLADRARITEHFHTVPWSGYEMIVKTGTMRAPEPWLFGAPTLAAVIVGVCKAAGCDWREALWNIPLVLAGHIIAAQCPGDDVKRPKDRQDLEEKRLEAIRRERAGEPHPWQIRYPEQYPPSGAQVKKNPHIADDIRREHGKLEVQKIPRVEKNQKKGK